MLTFRRPFLIVLMMIAYAALFIWLPLDHFRYWSAHDTIGYHVVDNWPRPPIGMVLGQVAGVAVDAQGHVVVFCRGERVWGGEALDAQRIAAPTVLKFDDEQGELIAAWGDNQFVMPHGLTIDAADNFWLTDVGLHQVFKFDSSGHLLMTVGVAGVPGNDSTHFNMPTDVAVASDGSFFVSDGYVNSRIVKFSAQGHFLLAWGTPGDRPGQFDVPHSIALDAVGHLYVADRGNARLQIFDREGKFLNEWKNLREYGRPWAVRIGPDGTVYIIDGGDQRVWLSDPRGDSGRAGWSSAGIIGRVWASAWSLYLATCHCLGSGRCTLCGRSGNRNACAKVCQITKLNSFWSGR